MGINQAALKQKYKTAAAAKSMSAAARALKNVSVSDLPKSSAQRDSRVRNAYAQREYVQSKAQQALADRQATEAFLLPIMAQGEAQAAGGAAAMNLSNKATQAVRANAENILAADWLSTLLAGSAKSYAAGFANIPGDIAQLGGASKREQELTALNAQLWGETDPTKRAQIEERINYLNANPGADNAVRKGEYYQTADRLALEAARERAQANKYAPTIVNDVISGGLQMGADVGLGALTGGGTLLPMTVRGYGGASQEARQQGANYGQSVMKGAASALTSYLTEQISGIGTSKITGVEGTLDNRIENGIAKLVKKYGKTAARQAVLNAALQGVSSFLGEGLEEGIEAFAQPVIDLIADKNALKQYGTGKLYLDVGYEALVGGLVGLLADGVQQAGGQYKSDRAGYEALETGAKQEKAQKNTAAETGADTYYFDAEDKNNSWRDRMYEENGKTYIQSVDRQRMYEVPKQSEISYEIAPDGSITLNDNIINQLDKKDYRDFIKAYAALNLVTQIDLVTGEEINPKVIITKSDGRRIIITQPGINDVAKKIRSAGIKSKDNVSSILLLDKIIENSVPVRTEANKHGGENPFTYYRSKFAVGGRNYDVTLHIKNSRRGDRYYYHALDKIEIASTHGNSGIKNSGIYQGDVGTSAKTAPRSEAISDLNIAHPNVENKGNLGVAQKNIAQDNNSQDNEFFDWLLDVKNREMPPRRKPDNGFLERLLGIENNEGKPKDNSRDKDRDGSYSR